MVARSAVTYTRTIFTFYGYFSNRLMIQYLIRRKAFTLLRGNSLDCKGFSYLREISCSVLLYQILSHLSSFIVRDSATAFDITDSSPTPGSLLPSASLPPYWQLSLFCKCQPGHGMGQNRILCGYLLKILFS